MCFSNINRFETQKVQIIDAALQQSSQVHKCPVEYNFYSLSNAQRTLAATLFVISIIAIIVGSLQLQGSGSTWPIGLIAAGSAAGGITLIVTCINHLYFKKLVNDFLATQKVEEWIKSNNFEDDMENNSNNASGTFNDTKSHFYRYSELPCGMTTFHVDFYRTKDITNQRWNA